MSISNWNAGIIRPAAVAPTGPYQDGVASGVWTLDQVAYWSKQGLWPTAGNVNPANIGLVFGGNTSTGIQSFSFSNLATLTNFGNLADGTSYPVGTSSSTRGVMSGGYNYIAETVIYTNVISYITIATAGNAIDFGDSTQARYAAAGASNQTTGLCAGGLTPSRVNTIDYITIASVGNAIDFGDLTSNNREMASCASTTRALFAGGQIDASTLTSNIQYNTIASTGNATNFGNLSYSARLVGGASSNTRALFAGGYSNSGPGPVNNIEYVTIATTGNAVDFGDLSFDNYFETGTSNSITAVFLNNGGGQKCTIATLGNATNFTNGFAKGNFGSLSGGHGGL